MKRSPVWILVLLIPLLIPLSVRSQHTAHAVLSGTTILDKYVGEETPFTLTMKDKNGNIIRGWNTSGNDVTLVVTNSTADLDAEPLTVMEVRDENHLPLTRQGLDKFILPRTKFVEGIAHIFFYTTKADTGIFITATPAVIGIKNVSERMNYLAGPIENFLVEIVPAKAPNIVYVLRRYELRVSPRDRYNNLNSSELIKSKFTARFPGEFTNQNLGSADIFAGELFIRGPMQNFFLISTQSRIDQSITCYKATDVNVRGTTAPFVISDHAPMGFSLLSPADNTEIFIDSARQSLDFMWQTAVDPYTNILVGGQTFSDVVKYKWVGSSTAGASLVEYGSNSAGLAPKLTLSGGQLSGIIDQASGVGTTKSVELLWHAEATDGLFTTRSTEQWRIKLTKRGITGIDQGPLAYQFDLGQNYPNPFNPTTQISFVIPKKSDASLKIFDLLGNEVATILETTLEAGPHTVSFDASRLATGQYLYKLTAGGSTAIKRMALVK